MNSSKSFLCLVNRHWMNEIRKMIKPLENKVLKTKKSLVRSISSILRVKNHKFKRTHLTLSLILSLNNQVVSWKYLRKQRLNKMFCLYPMLNRKLNCRDTMSNRRQSKVVRTRRELMKNIMKSSRNLNMLKLK